MRTRNLFRSCLLLLIPLLLLLCTACGSKTAVSSSYESVQDSAGILSESTEEEILETNCKLAAACGCRVQVLTVSSVNGMKISEYASKAFSEWECDSNTVLLVIASEDRDYWAVSGKDTALSSGALQRILETVFEPKFAAGEPDEGTKETFEHIVGYFVTYHQVTLPDEAPDSSGSDYSGWRPSLRPGTLFGELFGAVWDVLSWAFNLVTGLIRDIFGIIRALPTFAVIAIVIVLLVAFGRKSSKK